MEGIYGWIRNIVYYLIFVTMITNLLPAGKYEKYLRLFSGCVLILLVIQPVTGSLRLEEQITALFHSFSFENDAGELSAQMGEMESRRMKVLIRQYEETAAEDIARMAAMEGMEAEKVSVEIEGDSGNPEFGRVKSVTVFLKGMADGDEGEQTEAKTVDLVDPVKIRVETGDSDGAEGDSGGTGEKTASPYFSASQVSSPGGAPVAEAARLRQQIAGCYQVEERYVEVRLKNE